MKTAFLLAALIALPLLSSTHPAAASRRVETANRLAYAQSEFRVPQIPDHLRERAGAPPPEIAPQPKDKKSAQNDGSGAPATCNASNASSPQCYTATQQSRPATK